MYDIVWQDESVAGADSGYRGERIIFKELWPEEDESRPVQWQAYFKYGSLSAIYGKLYCALPSFSLSLSRLVLAVIFSSLS